MSLSNKHCKFCSHSVQVCRNWEHFSRFCVNVEYKYVLSANQGNLWLLFFQAYCFIFIREEELLEYAFQAFKERSQPKQAPHARRSLQLKGSLKVEEYENVDLCDSVYRKPQFFGKILKWSCNISNYLIAALWSSTTPVRYVCPNLFTFNPSIICPSIEKTWKNVFNFGKPAHYMKKTCNVCLTSLHSFILKTKHFHRFSWHSCLGNCYIWKVNIHEKNNHASRLNANGSIVNISDVYNFWHLQSSDEATLFVWNFCK